MADFVVGLVDVHWGVPDLAVGPHGRFVCCQELTEEQKQEIKEAFDLFDTDGSGASCMFRFFAAGLLSRGSGQGNGFFGWGGQGRFFFGWGGGGGLGRTSDIR